MWLILRDIMESVPTDLLLNNKILPETAAKSLLPNTPDSIEKTVTLPCHEHTGQLKHKQYKQDTQKWDFSFTIM